VLCSGTRCLFGLLALLLLFLQEIIERQKLGLTQGCSLLFFGEALKLCFVLLFHTASSMAETQRPMQRGRSLLCNYFSTPSVLKEARPHGGVSCLGLSRLRVGTAFWLSFTININLASRNYSAAILSRLSNSLCQEFPCSKGLLKNPSGFWAAVHRGGFFAFGCGRRFAPTGIKGTISAPQSSRSRVRAASLSHSPM
jgi:hypothetical protein